ncbi:3-oxoacyl-[acyl-carrier-protein] reductase FabG [Tsuneonella dongtanensis]|uniref:3-oxoacyl-[acyl-carrier-protein] reductase FabG n=1 Tax=Tsuneonella dongtanensis TaxID=692370 RepID=A0A1B2AEC7_9SPHN|nr:SDR family NAD(P)-dependent oxidoreductase [Tsuneonella dongtanensis]ANY20395.1 3-oxoacyl-[acyl-carrier-protein] reductase FabG [Tsuneonella dongtanensis]
MRLEGKTVLLTGGTAGIGEAMAHQLKAKGAEVILTGRSSDGLARMRDAGFEAIETDLSSPAGVRTIVDTLGEREIDVLINNAGQGVDHDFREAPPDPDAADDCIYANLNTPIRLIAAFVEQLKGRPQAAIVNVTSGLAIAPRAGGPVYCATKAGLRAYTQAIRAQLAGTSVNVIEALPPVVDTQMTAGRANRKMPAEECARQIIRAIEQDRTEANVGMVKLLKAVHSASPALARRIMLKF